MNLGAKSSFSELLEYAVENSDSEYFKMWNELNNKIKETFDIEYEKMKKISDIFKDTSLFSQVEHFL